MTRFGMPVGPVALLDDVGLDVAVKAGEVLQAAFPGRMSAAGARSPRRGRPARPQVGEGLLRLRRTESGASPSKEAYAALGVEPAEKPPMSDAEIEERLVLPMINEAAFCLEESVVARPEKLDLAMIFGTGFPPFRGGLLRYADEVGAGSIAQRLVGARPPVRSAVRTGSALRARSRVRAAGSPAARRRSPAPRPRELRPGPAVRSGRVVVAGQVPLRRTGARGDGVSISRDRSRGARGRLDVPRLLPRVRARSRRPARVRPRPSDSARGRPRARRSRRVWNDHPRGVRRLRVFLLRLLPRHRGDRPNGRLARDPDRRPPVDRAEGTDPLRDGRPEEALAAAARVR